MAKREIKDLSTYEVSIVKSPANLRKFLMWKDENGKEVPMTKTKKGKTTPIQKQMDPETMATLKQLMAILENNDDKIPDELMRMLYALTEMATDGEDGGEMDDDGMMDDDESNGKDGEMGDGSDGGEMEMEKATCVKKPEMTMKSENNKTKQPQKTPVTKTKEVEKPQADETPIQLTKAEQIESLNVNDEIKNQLKALWKSNEFLQKQLEKELEEKQERAFITKAQTEFTNIPMEPVEFGKLLKAINDANAETYEKMVGLFKSVDEILKQNQLLNEIGVPGYSNDDGSAVAQIEKTAKIFMESDPTITKAVAISKALETNPLLYDKYLKESAKRR